MLFDFFYICSEYPYLLGNHRLFSPATTTKRTWLSRESGCTPNTLENNPFRTCRSQRPTRGRTHQRGCCGPHWMSCVVLHGRAIKVMRRAAQRAINISKKNLYSKRRYKHDIFRTECVHEITNFEISPQKQFSRHCAVNGLRVWCGISTVAT